MSYRVLAYLPAISLSFYTQFATAAFINEVHYDNAGGDQFEAVELAGAAGEDLSGWQLQFYNGGRDGELYDSWELSGSIDDEGEGFGALSFALGGLQNGPADGIALIDTFGSLMEFISYEGLLTASEGDAAGSSSVDIGIAEDSSTPVGYSLQRTGSIDAFLWFAGESSFGDLNSGQQFVTATVEEPTAVPEPGGLALMAAGSLGLLLGRRRSR